MGYFRKLALLCIVFGAASSVVYASPVSYQTASAEEQAWQQRLQRSQRLEQMLNSLSKQALPRLNVQVHSVAKPYFEQQTATLHLSYTPLRQIEQSLLQAKTFDNALERNNAVLDIYELQAYQGIAQLLIKDYELPIVGDAQAAANSLATLLLLQRYPDEQGPISLLNSAALLEAKLINQPNYSGSHQYMQQVRLLNDALCLALGSNPSDYAELADYAKPSLNSEPCQRYYQQQQRAMQTLLNLAFN